MNPIDSSLPKESENSAVQKDRIGEKVSHLLRNKLQAISGGQYLLEAGINKNNWELVGTGWKVVKRNQVDLIRCSNHLMVLHRLDFLEPDPIQLDELLLASAQEFESLFGKSNINVAAGKSQDPILLDPFVIRSTFIGLIRLASHSDSEKPNPVDVQLEQPGNVIKFKFHSEVCFEGSNEANPSLSVEWNMADKVVSVLGGTLTYEQKDAACCFLFELPLN